MAKKSTLLDQMQANPTADWNIAKISRLCAKIGLEICPPAHGSHYTITSKYLSGILTIPARRPIKPVYVRKLVALARAHLQAAKEKP